MSAAVSTAPVVWPWPGWRGYPCADASHSGLILKRCADCGKRKNLGGQAGVRSAA